jgi:Vacuolar protein 14 C-terminal Fig4p binding
MMMLPPSVILETVMQADRMVQLLESPVFCALRLSLLGRQTESRKALERALFTLLMILPQTKSFELLRKRLKCVNMCPPPSCTHESDVTDQLAMKEIPLHMKTSEFMKILKTNINLR